MKLIADDILASALRIRRSTRIDQALDELRGLPPVHEYLTKTAWPRAKTALDVVCRYVLATRDVLALDGIRIEHLDLEMLRANLCEFTDPDGSTTAEYLARMKIQQPALWRLHRGLSAPRPAGKEEIRAARYAFANICCALLLTIEPWREEDSDSPLSNECHRGDGNGFNHVATELGLPPPERNPCPAVAPLTDRVAQEPEILDSVTHEAALASPSWPDDMDVLTWNVPPQSVPNAHPLTQIAMEVGQMHSPLPEKQMAGAPSEDRTDERTILEQYERSLREPKPHVLGLDPTGAQPIEYPDFTSLRQQTTSTTSPAWFWLLLVGFLFLVFRAC